MDILTISLTRQKDLDTSPIQGNRWCVLKLLRYNPTRDTEHGH